MKNNKTRAFTIVAGVLTAVAIILSQLFYYQGAQFCKKEQTSENHEKKAPADEPEEAFVAGPSTSVLTSTHVDLTHKTFVLFEILFPEKEEDVYQSDLPLTLGKYFHTLFRIIISPNAP